MFPSCPLLAPKQTSARIDFLRQGGRLVDKKGSYNVKFLIKNRTKQTMPCTLVKTTATESRYVYDQQRKRLQGMLLTTNGNSIMQTQKWSATDSQFSTCRESIEWLLPAHLLAHNHVLPQANGAEFQISPYLCPALRAWVERSSWFYSTKTINSSQFIGTFSLSQMNDAELARTSSWRENALFEEREKNIKKTRRLHYMPWYT